MNADVLAAPTIGSALRRAARQLQAAGFPTPELDARCLVGVATGLDTAGMIANSRSTLRADIEGRIDQLLARRLDGEPVARIVGAREFWSLEFRLGRETLVPRPDSETLVEAILASVGPDRRKRLCIADLGTGSGCLLVALLSELPAAFGIGTDLSFQALAIARQNAELHSVGYRASFIAGSWAEALAPGLDVIVANPPYIPSEDVAGLAAEVAKHDPVAALDGGPDGLEAYRALIPQAARLLAPGGLLALEFGIGQKAAVADLLSDAGLRTVNACLDLGGIDRVLVSASPVGEGAPEKPLGIG